VGGFEYPPYSILKELYIDTMTKKIDIIDSHYREVDVFSLFHIENIIDIDNLRMIAINYIWKENGFPLDKTPSKIELNISDKIFLT